MNYFTRNRYVAGNICFILFLAFLFSLAFNVLPGTASATSPPVTEDDEPSAPSGGGVKEVVLTPTTETEFATVVEDLLEHLGSVSDLVTGVVYKQVYQKAYEIVSGTVYRVYEYTLWLVYGPPPAGYSVGTDVYRISYMGLQNDTWQSVYVDVPVPVPRYVGGGGGGGGGGGAAPPSGPTVPPGAEPPVTDTVVNEAIAQAEETGVVAISAPEEQEAVALTPAQLANIQEADKPLAVQVSGVQFTLPPAVVATLAGVEGAQVEITAAPLAAAEAQQLAAQATNAALFRLAGNVYELNIAAVQSDGDRLAITDLGATIRISLPVPDDEQEAAAAGTLTAGWYNEATNAWEELVSTYDAATQTMAFEVTHLSKYALLEKVVVPPQPLPRKSFADIVGHWAQDDIEIMAGLEIARGVGDNKFNPDGQVTRAEFAALLIRSLGIEEVPATQTHFKDVATSDWYAGAVETAYAHGLVAGYGDGTFRPNANISREEIAALVTRGLQRLGKTVDVTGRVDSLLAQFVDQAQISEWAREVAAAAVDEGIVRGRGGNLFAPQANASRAEAVVMLKRMLVNTGEISN